MNVHEHTRRFGEPPEDLIKIRDKIEENLKLLRATSRELKIRSKAEAIGNYEKKIAVTMLKLRQGQVVELDGEEVAYSVTTGLDKIAKGVCYKESIALDLAESAYKNAVIGIQTVQVEINALQSILRYMEE